MMRIPQWKKMVAGATAAVVGAASVAGFQTQPAAAAPEKNTKELLGEILERVKSIESDLGIQNQADFKYPLSKYGGKVKGDKKDTETFKYFTYDECPKFTPKHRSLMSKELAGVWDQLKDKKSKKGYTLSNAIQTGVETPHLGVGVTVGDEESWEVFKPLLYPVIKGWHKGYDAYTMTHKKDLDPSKLTFSSADAALFDKYVVSTRIRAARNVSGYSLPSGTDDADRESVKNLLVKAFNEFDGDLKGTYYPLEGMSDEVGNSLRKQGFLFQVPKRTNLLTMAGAARNWPHARGIFHNDNKTALCWVNEEDHCRIISMAMGGNVKDVFGRFCEISKSLSRVAESQGTKLMWSDNLGFLGTCPSNLGTGLRASVMIVLPELNKDVETLEKVCDAFDLQPRGSAGEHSAAEGGKWDISNKQRIGFTEVQLVQKMIDGVKKLIKIEEKLAAGGKVEASDLA